MSDQTPAAPEKKPRRKTPAKPKAEPLKEPGDAPWSAPEPQPQAQKEPETNLALLPPPERAVIVLKSKAAEKELREMIVRTAAVTNVVDQAGRQEAHGAYMMLKNARVAITNRGKVAREDAQAFSKAVIAEEKRLIEITEAEESRLQKLRDDFDAAEKKRLEEEAERERVRVNAIKEKIAGITGLAAGLAASSSKIITAALADLAKLEVTEQAFGEFADEARAAIDTTASALLQLRNAARDKEEAARLAAEAAEAERVRLEEQKRQQAAEAQRQAEEAERQRQERERLAAEERRIEAERLAQQRAEAEKEKKRMHAKSRIQNLKEVAAQGGSVRELQDRLELLRTYTVGESFGDMAEFAELALEVATTTVEAKLKQALAEELPAAHAEALEMNVQFDAERAQPEPQPEPQVKEPQPVEHVYQFADAGEGSEVAFGHFQAGDSDAPAEPLELLDFGAQVIDYSDTLPSSWPAGREALSDSEIVGAICMIFTLTEPEAIARLKLIDFAALEA